MKVATGSGNEKLNINGSVQIHSLGGTNGKVRLCSDSNGKLIRGSSPTSCLGSGTSSVTLPSCGTTASTCSSGSVSELADTDTQSKWECKGNSTSGGDLTVSCSGSIEQPVSSNIALGSAQCKYHNCNDNAVCGVDLPISISNPPSGYTVAIANQFSNGARVSLSTTSKNTLTYTEDGGFGTVSFDLQLKDSSGKVVSISQQSMNHGSYWQFLNSCLSTTSNYYFMRTCTGYNGGIQQDRVIKTDKTFNIGSSNGTSLSIYGTRYFPYSSTTKLQYDNNAGDFDSYDATGDTTYVGCSTTTTGESGGYDSSGGTTSYCGTDLYKSGSSCISVGNGYYSPNDNDNRYSCSTKPSNSYYNSDGNGGNACSWSCSSGYYKSGNSCIAYNPGGGGYGSSGTTYSGTWQTTSAPTCSTSCGQSATTKYGSVYCSTYNNTDCNPSTKPSTPSRYCSATSVCAPTYSGTWVQTQPSSCSTSCGQSATWKYGTVYCSGGTCNLNTKPSALSRYCSATSACAPTYSGTWQNYGWGSCSNSCGYGTQSRYVYCSGGTCDPNTKPVTSQSCYSSSGCGGYGSSGGSYPKGAL